MVNTVMGRSQRSVGKGRQRGRCTVGPSRGQRRDRMPGGPELTRRETAMKTEDLTLKHCAPCEGGVPALTEEQARQLLAAVPGWGRTADGKRLRREWRARDFVAALDFFRRVGELAEEEGHHPDLHLVEYRNVAIEIWTHAVGGLTENDFILAAKIDQLPIKVKGG